MRLGDRGGCRLCREEAGVHRDSDLHSRVWTPLQPRTLVQRPGAAEVLRGVRGRRELAD